MTDWSHDEYLVRRKLLTLLGGAFHVFDNQGNLLLYSRQKAFKLREDIRIYSDETMAEERLVIKARQIVDFSAAYDVVDPREQTKIGALRRRGFRSMVRDSWEILDNADQPIATIQEDSQTLALIRRFLTNLIPQKFTVGTNGQAIAHFKQNFNPFVQKLQVALEPGAREKIDPRLLVAAGILLVAVEGRQR